MKKKIGIGCGILILSALVLGSVGNLNAAAKAKGSLGEIAVASTGEEVLGSGASENASNSAQSTKQEEGLLYYIKTSLGNNLGTVPIVNGNAVVLLDKSKVTVQQGEYTPKEKNAFALKLENETAKAVSDGKIAAWAFYREPMLEDFVFPEGVAAIEKFAFARSGLNSVEIPDGVASIGYGAFYHCDTLTEVTIPKSVTVIEENAFTHTPWLKNWLAGAETEGEDTKAAGSGDFLIVGDGILLAYRGSEAEPELPAEVKSVVPGALGE